ncbi:hypothetical protein C4J81_03730 [Deltaproteobacteria bacterium Smac51]|nr:hypothetical protein C4J81_03730 [Deltaproteobacteria bacterium Smac51]
MYVLSLFFLLLGFLSLVMILASIFTPKTAVFLKTKTRLRGAVMWIMIGFTCLAAIGWINQIQYPGAQGISFDPFWMFP